LQPNPRLLGIALQKYLTLLNLSFFNNFYAKQIDPRHHTDYITSFNYAAWIDKINVGRKNTTRFNKRNKTRTKMKIKFCSRNLKFPEHENASKINF